MYKQIVRLLNRDTAFRLLKWDIRLIGKLPFARALVRLGNKRNVPELEREIFDMKFPNPIGLGPGLDKDAQMYNTMSDFGYSFVDIGPVNSSNVKLVINRLQSNVRDIIISLCINKNHSRTFSLAYDFADMFVLEIPDDEIMTVLDDILDIRLTYPRSKPVLLRITHEFAPETLRKILDFCLLNGVDGLVVAKASYVAHIHQICGELIPIIGYGGVRTAEAAREMLDGGASLIEITTGLVLDGPKLIKKILKDLGN